MSRRARSSFSLLCASLAVLCSGCRWKDEAPSEAAPNATGAPSSFAPLVKRVLPAVVGIYTQTPDQQQSLGTGVIIDRDGLTLTNSHVVPDRGSIEVRFFDGHRARARLLGRDEETDIALVKIDSPGRRLTVAPLGDSERADIGEWVIAIGQPFGLSHSVTVGILSAKGRTAWDMQSQPSGHGYWYYLQTDASINRGNSGGPLIDMRGTVIGINTMIHQEPEKQMIGHRQEIVSVSKMGFAIPIDLIRMLVPELRRDGKIARSWLGVEPEMLEPDEAALRGLPGAKGVLVHAVRPDSPAIKAGIRQGDVILAFDGKDVRSDAELRWVASTAGVGHRARVKLWRQGREQQIEVALERKPEDKKEPEP